MIRRLQLRGFRNLERLDWSPGAGVHFLLGATGHGKTSLLEAIYVAATSRSFRTHKLQQCARFEELLPSESREVEGDRTQSVPQGNEDAGFWIRAEVASGDVRSVQEVYWSPEGVVRRSNGEIVAVGEYLAVQPVVVWSSSDLETLVGGPALRRRLLDRGIVVRRPRMLDVMSTYRRALQHKRSLLQQPRVDIEQVRSINSLLAQQAYQWSRARHEHSARLQQAIEEAHVLLGRSQAALQVFYGGHEQRHEKRLERSSEATPHETVEDGEERYYQRLDSAINEEIRRRRPLVGPHLDPVELIWKGYPVGEIASAGEKKSLGLTLALAQVLTLQEHDIEPILLLDDFDTELDLDTFGAFAPLVKVCEQTFITSNRRDALERFASHLGVGESASSAASQDREQSPTEGHFDAFWWSLEEGVVESL